MPTTIETLRMFFYDLFGVLIVTSTLKSILRSIRKGTFLMDWSRFEFISESGKIVIGYNYYRHGKTIVELS
jgi:hypothetical protein